MTEPTPMRPKRQPDPLPNRERACVDAEDFRAAVIQLTRLADSVEKVVPAADVVHDFAERLDKLCVFIKRKGPWLLASVPLIATAVGAISPEVGNGLKAIIAALG